MSNRSAGRFRLAVALSCAVAVTVPIAAGAQVSLGSSYHPPFAPAPVEPAPKVCATAMPPPTEPAHVVASAVLEAALALRRIGDRDAAAGVSHVAFHLVNFIDSIGSDDQRRATLTERSGDDISKTARAVRAAAVTQLDRAARWLAAPLASSVGDAAPRVGILFRGLIRMYRLLGADRARLSAVSVTVACRAPEFVALVRASSGEDPGISRRVMSDLISSLHLAVDVPPRLYAWSARWALHGQSLNRDLALNVVSDTSGLIGRSAPPVVAESNARVFAWCLARAIAAPTSDTEETVRLGRAEALQNLVMYLYGPVFDYRDVTLLPYLEAAFVAWRATLEAYGTTTDHTEAFAKRFPIDVADLRATAPDTKGPRPSDAAPYTPHP